MTTDMGRPSTTTHFARAVATAGLLVTGAGLAVELAGGDYFDVGLIGFSLVGVVIVWHRRDNVIGWLMLGVGTLPSVSALAGRWHPGWLPLAELVHVSSKMTEIGFALLPFIVALFPTGRLPSPRWRWPTRLAAAGVVLVGVIEVVRTDGSDPPIRIAAVQPMAKALAAPVASALVVYGLAALVHAGIRTRRATGDEREQMRWFVASASVFPGLMIVNAFSQGAPWQGVVLVSAFAVGMTAIAVGIGVAVLKYRLYSIDVVINRALVYGSLALAIALVYAAVVAVVGSQIDPTRKSHFLLSVVATTLAALALQPLRERFQRIANRLVYGTRLSPYEAVSAFAHRVAEFAAFDEVLPEMAEAAALSVGAVRSRVRLFLPHGGEESVHWPEGDASVSFDRVLPVLDGGDQVGEIAVAKAAGDQVTPHDEQLLATLVSEASLAMRSLRLTEELEQRLVELQDSRRRLVTAQDQERRRMERDIHDGAQQQLVAMKIKLGLARALVQDEPSSAAALLDELSVQSTEALDCLRDLARGLFPQVLVERGVGPALAAHIAKSGLDALVEVDPALPRLDLQVEANVYFVLREAMQNTSKYAPGASTAIDLRPEAGGLRFVARDTGPGFDVQSMKPGNGTQNMRDRVEALGGTLEVLSAPGSGTEIRGWVPVTHVPPLQEELRPFDTTNGADSAPILVSKALVGGQSPLPGSMR